MPPVRAQRTLVAITPTNRVLDQGAIILTPGQSWIVYLETLSTSDSSLDDLDLLLTPAAGDPTLFRSTGGGNLLNIMASASTTGLTVTIHEAVHTTSNTWQISDSALVTPGVPFYNRAFRVVAPLAKVTFANTNTLNPNLLQYLVRASSM